jgi:hypothetical protein
MSQGNIVSESVASKVALSSTPLSANCHNSVKIPAKHRLVDAALHENLVLDTLGRCEISSDIIVKNIQADSSR